MKVLNWGFISLFSFFLTTATFAQIPQILSYQGVLTDSAGVPFADNPYEITFRLYEEAEDGSVLWSEADIVMTSKGLFNTILGDQNNFYPTIKFDRQYWLSLQVGNEAELLPRIALTSTPYSIHSLNADTAQFALRSIADSTWINQGINIYRLSGFVGIGKAAPEARLHLRGSENNGANAALKIESSNSLMLIDGNEIDEVNGGLFLNHNSPHKLILATGGGLVGVGTTIPSGGKLHVVGSDNNGTSASLKIESGDQVMLIDGNEIDVTTGALWLNNNSQNRVLISPNGGNVGIGTSSPNSTLHVEGTTRTKILEITGGADLAEPFEMTGSINLTPGALVVIDKENPGKLKVSETSYDSKVAGVISGAGGIEPGLTLKQDGVLDSGQNVALTGRVYALATSQNGEIQPGDLLTTSNIAGHAMKATDLQKRSGAIIGKAMSPLTDGEGLVMVLVNLQ